MNNVIGIVLWVYAFLKYACNARGKPNLNSLNDRELINMHANIKEKQY